MGFDFVTAVCLFQSGGDPPCFISGVCVPCPSRVVFAYPQGYPEGFRPILLGMASREARLAQKLLAEVKLTHVPGLKQKCTELGLTRRTLQEYHRDKTADCLAAVEEVLRGDFGADFAAAIVRPKTHGNCQAKRPRLADLAQRADGSWTVSGTVSRCTQRKLRS